MMLLILPSLLLFLIPLFVLALPPYHSSARRDHGPPLQDNDDHGQGGFDFSAHPWIPASQIANSSRSPCPLLNTIANHGFLPRSGRSLSISTFNQALVDSINLSDDFANTLTVSNFRLLGLLGPTESYTEATIDMETLNAYGKTEHDASLTRLDRIEGYGLTAEGTPKATLLLNQELLGKLLADSPAEYLDTKSLGLSHLRRQRESLAVGSPPLSPGSKEACLNEAGLIVQLLGEGGDPNEIGGGPELWDQRKARKDDVWEWFMYERFPRDWRRTTHQITGEGDMVPLGERVAYWENFWNGSGYGQ